MQNWIKTVMIAVSLVLPGVALAQSLESLVNVQKPTGGLQPGGRP